MPILHRNNNLAANTLTYPGKLQVGVSLRKDRKDNDMSTPQRPPRPVKPPFSSQFTQMFPPRPSFTEKDISDLSGKVYIVTGSNTGVGKEVTQILYSKNAKVYVATRSEERANQAITNIKQTWPQSTGSLIYQHLDNSLRKKTNFMLFSTTLACRRWLLNLRIT